MQNAKHDDYKLTQSWFIQAGHGDVWSRISQVINAKSYLEIGSYEGLSACWMIENTDVEALVCIDTWEGGEEHKNVRVDMSQVEERFDHNVSIAGERVSRQIELTKLKGTSLHMLADLVAKGGSGVFDVVYVDGSHRSCDVMGDAVLGFELLRPGGCIIFDDYIWYDKTTNDGVRSSPKLAIDAFSTCFFEQIQFVTAPVGQMILIKNPPQ
jgi:predicted O-methyltransferase YrrM